MTAAQNLRLKGFNASLKKRGVVLELESGERFDALIEDIGALPGEFVVDSEIRMFSRVHILRDSANLSSIQFGSVLTEIGHRIDGQIKIIEDGRVFTVRNSEPHDIKTTFRAEVETPSEDE